MEQSIFKKHVKYQDIKWLFREIAKIDRERERLLEIEKIVGKK